MLENQWRVLSGGKTESSVFFGGGGLSNFGPGIVSIDVTWELIITADSQAPAQTY